MAYFQYQGIRLFYEEKGDTKSLHKVIFLNGVMASTSSWVYQVPAIERLGVHIILMDFKGQLKSDKPEGPYRFSEHAQETLALVQSLGVEKAHLIGTSYGGEIAMRIAIDYPRFVQSLSIIDSTSELDAVMKAFIHSWKILAKAADGEKFFLGMMPSIYGKSFIEKHQDFLQQRAIATGKMDREYFRGQYILYEAFENDVTMTHELHKIGCPTLVICGEDDLLKPVKFSRIIAQHIANSEFVVIPDCGHVTIFEKPNVLNTLLTGFIAKNMV